MNCQQFDATLDALLDGRCAGEDWRAAEAHLADCARCRRIHDAMSGQADDLDDEGHESLAASVLARTSGAGGACTSARERLCDYVDDALDAVERELVGGHLARCAPCRELADALSQVTADLPSFADLAPRPILVPRVLAATSLRTVPPSLRERAAEWLARAAQRPRFSLEVAYVLTVLLLVVFGNPVDAFREASVRVQPRVSAVAGSVRRPLSELKAAGERRLSGVEQALASTSDGTESPRRVEAFARQVFDGSAVQGVLSAAQSMVDRVAAWAGQAWDWVRRVVGNTASEPAESPARSSSRS